MKNNKVILIGKIAAPIIFEYEYEGEEFYMTMLRIQRKNPEAFDEIPVMISGMLLNKTIQQDDYLYVSGEYRSRNQYEDGKSRLMLYVFAQEVMTVGREDYRNEIDLAGYICKPTIKRTTPGGRVICDVLIASNRNCGRSDYIPCIAWGRAADRVALMDVGAEIQIAGRIQSRLYNKKIDGKIEQRTAYEVSITDIL